MLDHVDRQHVYQTPGANYRLYSSDSDFGGRVYSTATTQLLARYCTDSRSGLSKLYRGGCRNRRKCSHNNAGATN